MPEDYDPTHTRPFPVDGDDDVFTVDTRRRTPVGAAGPRRASSPQPPRQPRPGPRPSEPDRPDRPRPATGRRLRHPFRAGLIVVLVLLLAWGGGLVWAASSAWGHVVKIDAEPKVADRPAQGAGRNYLLVGSDSRAGLTKAQRKRLATGNAPGQRTDSIMLMHLPGNGGKPTLVSIPRDSYVPIRGHIKNKINASYSIGGSRLLIDTVEQVSGLRIDGFIEIGFGGFANVVDSVGGVRMCLKHRMKDKKAGINLKAGCQVLNGKNALGYVRARYSDPLGDLGRVQRQRQFLGALMAKAVTPSNVLLPWRLNSLGAATGSAVSVDQNDSMLEVAKVLMALRSVAQGDGQSVTVPISNPNLLTPVGDAVKWDSAKAVALFDALKNDKPLSVQPS